MLNFNFFVKCDFLFVCFIWPFFLFLHPFFLKKNLFLGSPIIGYMIRLTSATNENDKQYYVYEAPQPQRFNITELIPHQKVEKKKERLKRQITLIFLY